MTSPTQTHKGKTLSYQPRSRRLICFDGRPVLYTCALSQLARKGVDMQMAVTLLDTADILDPRLFREARFAVPHTSTTLVDRHAQALAKVGDAVKSGAKAVGSAVVSGAKKAGETARKVGEAAKKADESFEKATGGGDEDCEWITIKGGKGTTRICIDHEGKIKLGPKGLAGSDASTLTNDRQAVERAKGAAKQKKEEAEKREKALGNKIRDWSDRADDLASVAMSFMGGDFALGIGSVATKFLAERVGFVKKATNGLRDWLTNRYGQAGATAIVVAGMATMKAADLVVPGVGTAMGFIPGGHLIAALPVVAVLETGRFALKEAGHVGGGFKRLMSFLGSGGVASAKVSGGGKKAKFADAEDDVKGKDSDRGKSQAFLRLSDKDIERLGRKFMDKLKEKILADWEANMGRFQKIAGRLKKSMKKGKGKGKGKAEKSAGDGKIWKKKPGEGNGQSRED